jgi:predicted RND superfamily exporter protein
MGLDRLVPLLVPLLSGDIGDTARQAGRDGILYAVTAILGLIGLALALAGAVVWLSDVIGTGPALLTVAGTVLLPIPVILALMAHWRRIERQRHDRQWEQDLVADALRVGASVLLPLLLRAPAAFLVVAAGLVVFLLVLDTGEVKTRHGQGPE